MTEQEKQILLVDLCTRLPYEPKARKSGMETNINLTTLDSFYYGDEIILPYLRPMSSMTEEEKEIMDNLWKDNNKLVFADPSEIRRYRFYDISVVDFLNSHHFDYRGLIPMGLALEAPEDMYKTE